MSRVFPSSPLDIETTKKLLQERIDRGEIEQKDIDLLKRGYKWMALSTALGATAGIPVYMIIGKRRPPLPFWRKLAFASFAASSMAFTGLTIGSAAAAVEVNNNMPDSQRKMKVFQQVMIETKRRAEEERLGISKPVGRPAGSAFPGSTGDIARAAGAGAGVWDPETEEQKTEVERELEVQRMQSQGRDFRARQDERPSGAPRGAGASPGIDPKPMSSWDRLRTANKPSSASSADTTQPGPSTKPVISRPQVAAPVGRPDDQSSYDRVDEEEREREKREFEELLERERHAGGQDSTAGPVWR